MGAYEDFHFHCILKIIIILNFDDRESVYNKSVILDGLFCLSTSFV